MRYLSTFNYSWFIYMYDVLWFALALISNSLGLLGMGKTIFIKCVIINYVKILN